MVIIIIVMCCTKEIMSQDSMSPQAVLCSRQQLASSAVLVDPSAYVTCASVCAAAACRYLHSKCIVHGDLVSCVLCWA